jgi:hypothetical protein
MGGYIYEGEKVKRPGTFCSPISLEGFVPPSDLDTSLILCIVYRSDPIIRLNFEELESLDEVLVGSFDGWVRDAPEDWKADGFLVDNAPIVVTSCFGQNARIVVPGNEGQEARNWYEDRDYNKIAFLTVALATSIK